MGGFGQFAATSQFFLYGRRHFTQTGYAAHVAGYSQPDVLTQPMDLSEHVFIITGGNSGVGKEIAQFLLGKKATVFIVCRSAQRGEAARADMAAATGNSKAHVLVGDVGLEADVRRCWAEFCERSGSECPRLDALVCNAGALMNEKTLTAEGLEVTFASHLLFGTYLLGTLAMPALKGTKDSRFIAVSSGGMYNVPFPAWEIASSTSYRHKDKYDGQLAYAYAKRGQVLLCERWATLLADAGVTAVSCHPGWTATPAVDHAYGDQKKYLEPMRTPWQGAEGIVWLCVAPAPLIQSGAFYLDRKPQVKHMSGPFFTEGTYTKNTAEEVDQMMQNLDDWANGRRPKDLAEQAHLHKASSEARLQPLTALERPIELSRFMGKWYVIRNIPTALDRDTVNNIEDYSYDEATKTIKVDFTYCNKSLTKKSRLLQKAKVANEFNTHWTLSPKFGLYLPLRIPYLLVDLAEDYSTTIVGVPDRSYVWLMARTPKPEASVVEEMTRKTQMLGYDVTKLVDVPQIWDGHVPEEVEPEAPEAATD